LVLFIWTSGNVWYTFHIYLQLLVFDHYRYAPTTLRMFKSSTFKTLSSSKWESMASGPWPFCSNMLSLSSIHYLNALIGYLSLHTLGLGSWLLVLLSHVVLSHCTSLLFL
jgi:hypothetical protein